ncbi:gametogenetin [Actinomyces oris]|uniref:gametogenetin n=1 Tax=Actinomyces oris TaxID=544580 RepID=UPI0028D395D1|nr:gametogenetin [Actinomyces oris]
MTSVRRPSVSTRRMGARARFAQTAVAGTVLLTGVSGCAQVDLDQLAGSVSGPASPSTASQSSTAPSRMVMPTALPTAQATAAAALTVGFPDLPGYTASTASPTATSAPHGSTTPTGPATASTPEASWSRSYASTSSGCQVSAEVTSAAALLVSGGDDRALSEHWSASLAGTYPDYRQTGREELTATNRSAPYAGIATTFSASLRGSRVAGRAFVRVWSADGAAVSVTQVCQQGVFDEAAWDAVLRGVAVDGLSGQSRWPTKAAPGSETPAASATG